MHLAAYTSFPMKITVMLVMVLMTLMIAMIMCLLMQVMFACSLRLLCPLDHNIMQDAFATIVSNIITIQTSNASSFTKRLFSRSACLLSSAMEESWDENELRRLQKSVSLKRRLEKSGYREKTTGSSSSTSATPREGPPVKKSKIMKKPGGGPAKDTDVNTMDKCLAKVKEGRHEDPIIVGSDCSGIGADMFAFKLLGIDNRIEHKFASEKDPVTRKTYEANHTGLNKMYESCTLDKRPVGSVPRVTIYVAGPPCQPFSGAGRREGLKDTGSEESGNQNRGTVLLDVIGYIINRHPKMFLIEEVKGLNTGAAKKLFDKVINMLQNVSSRGKPLYHVEWRVVNTFDIGGIPQNRERIYIAGMWKSLASNSKDIAFEWPGCVRPPKLSHFLKPNHEPTWMPTAKFHLENLLRLWNGVKENEGQDPADVMFCFDISASEKFCGKWMKEKSPTITRARAGGGGYYLSAWKRMMSTSDICKLQGFPTTLKNGGATDRQVRQMLGNAMTVTVVARIVRMLLGAAGYIDLDIVADPVE